MLIDILTMPVCLSNRLGNNFGVLRMRKVVDSKSFTASGPHPVKDADICNIIKKAFNPLTAAIRGYGYTFFV